MTWFRSDDGLPDHPKVLELSEGRHYKAAMGLWVLAGCWSSKHLTDGTITFGAVKRLGFAKAEAAALVACGLWEETETGYQFHDWADSNPLRAEVEAKREATAARVKRHRNGVGNALHARSSNGVGNAPPGPARPDPARPDHHPSGDSARLSWRDVGVLYAERYTPKTGNPVAMDLHKREFEAIAVQAAGDPAKVEKSLTAFMADEYAEKKRDFSPALWAKQFGRYLRGEHDPVAAAADTSARQREQLARIDAQILGKRVPA